LGANPGPSLREGCLWIIVLVYDRNVELIGVVGGSHAFGKDDFRYLDPPLRNFDFGWRGIPENVGAGPFIQAGKYITW
jgi:hypothetical protein